MSWHKRPGTEHDHIDGRTLIHNIHLLNSHTGAEHHLHILLKSDCCAVCKRPFNKGYAHLTDPGAELDAALAMLHPNHAAVLDYSRQHNLPILLGDLATTIPDGHKMVNPRGRRMLFPTKDEK